MPPGYTVGSMNSSAHIQLYGEGAEIYSPFSSDKRVHFIETGFVTAATLTDEGKNRIHLIYGPGSYFPILSVFRSTQQRATYRALTEVKLSSISTLDFLDRLDTDREFCRDTLSRTVEQLSMFADRVIDLQTTKLSDQLLLKLQTLAKDQGQKIGAYSRLPYKLRHHEIADLLGVERESVSRALKNLEKNGFIITTKNGLLKILI